MHADGTDQNSLFFEINKYLHQKNTKDLIKIYNKKLEYIGAKEINISYHIILAHRYIGTARAGKCSARLYTMALKSLQYWLLFIEKL